MRIARPLLVAFTLLFSASSFGQYYYYNSSHYDRDLLFELGGGVGGMNSITDLGGSKGNGGMYINDMNLRFTKLSGSVYFGIVYQQLAGVRLEATWGSVESADSILKGATNLDALSRYNRNLNFRSSINEVALIGEFYPLPLFFKDQLPVLSPYIMAGLGYYRFNPQVLVNGRYVDAKPLSTEGQRFPEFRGRESYSLKQVNVPVGFGVKYELSQLFNLRLEVLHRFLFTDHLDDVSGTYIDRVLFDKNLPPMLAEQANAVYNLKRNGEPRVGSNRGNTDSKDSYVTISLKVGVTLGRRPL